MQLSILNRLYWNSIIHHLWAGLLESQKLSAARMQNVTQRGMKLDITNFYIYLFSLSIHQIHNGLTRRCSSTAFVSPSNTSLRRHINGLHHRSTTISRKTRPYWLLWTNCLKIAIWECYQLTLPLTRQHNSLHLFFVDITGFQEV